MEDELFTKRFGNKLLCFRKDGTITGCYRDDKYYIPAEFDRDIFDLVNQVEHAQSLTKRMDL